MNAPWQPTSTDAARQRRASVYRKVRDFFHHRGVLEVETPIWSRAANTDPNIDSVPAGDGWLRTSPEFPMKRLLAAGSGPIYELGRVFRAAESGRLHNPEFTMLEWYRPGFDYRQLADEVVALIQALASESGHGLALHKSSYRELVSGALGIDPLTITNEDLTRLVNDRGWYDGPLERSELLDLAFSFGVAPNWSANQLTVVTDFPACQCALARIDPDNEKIAMRFEVFWGATELANGYDELLDATAVADRFTDENQRREKTGKPRMPIDLPLLKALQEPIECCAGVALGVDRLLMKLQQADRLSEVINFPGDRA